MLACAAIGDEMHTPTINVEGEENRRKYYSKWIVDQSLSILMYITPVTDISISVVAAVLVVVCTAIILYAVLFYCAKKHSGISLIILNNHINIIL